MKMKKNSIARSVGLGLLAFLAMECDSQRGFLGATLGQEKSNPVVAGGDKAIGLDAKAIADLDAWIEEARKEWQVPGLAVAVVWEDRLLLC